MTTHAGFTVQMYCEPLSIGQWFFFHDFRQDSVYAWRWGRNLLGEEMNANEQAAGRWRCFCRFASQNEERSMTKDSGASRFCWVLNTRKLSLGHRHTIDLSQTGANESVIGGEELHKIHIVPNKMAKQLPSFFSHRCGQFTIEFAILSPISRGI